VTSRNPSPGALFVGWLALCLCAPARGSDPTPVASTPDLTGPRTIGLSSTIGTASGNEGLVVNPGAIAARRRYSVDLGGLLDRRDATNVGEVATFSVVDGITTGITTGVAWSRIFEGVHQGDIYTLALAGSPGQGLFVGASGKWLQLTGPTGKTDRVTMDAGLLWQASQYVSVGVAGYNLVPTHNEALAPRGMGAGLAIGTDRLVQVTGEWSADLDAPKTLNRYAAGVEALLGQQFPLRVGYVHDEKLDTRWWSVGAGAVQRRFGIDVGYRQGIDDPQARVLAASIKGYFME
jgi:hypothetical protein